MRSSRFRRPKGPRKLSGDWVASGTEAPPSPPPFAAARRPRPPPPPPVKAPPRPWRKTQVILLAQYMVLLAVAEILLLYAGLSGDGLFSLLGLLIDVFLLVSLPIEASFFAAKDAPFATFLGALLLPPLTRVVTLSTPGGLFTQTEWLIVVSVPLLLACAALMRAQRLRPRDVFLSLGERRYLTLNVTLAAAGLGMGFAEFRILRPEAWIDGMGTSELAIGAIAILLGTGLAEELIYRGILLRNGVRFLGTRGGLLYVTGVYAILHIGFMSPLDLALVFGFGLILGIVVLFTKSLTGAIGAHTLANIALYLILPFGF